MKLINILKAGHYKYTNTRLNITYKFCFHHCLAHLVVQANISYNSIIHLIIYQVQTYDLKENNII